MRSARFVMAVVLSLALSTLLGFAAPAAAAEASASSGVWLWGHFPAAGPGDCSVTRTNTTVPVPFNGLGTDIVQLAGGSNFAVALKTDGTVWTWGDNTYG